MNEQQAMNEQAETLLICTVGGSPEPIVAAIKHWRPQRIRFITSPETLDKVKSAILPLAEHEQSPIEAGRYDCLELSDGQNLEACLQEMSQLTSVVEDWRQRGSEYQVVVDLTGGTKCMSAALALQARLWPCIFSYVGGIERTKDGVGVVISGKEQVLHTHNPWDVLGFQATEEYLLWFNQRAYRIASQLADRAMKNVSDPCRKRECSALKLLADAYEAWDRFDHNQALKTFNDLERNHNDLKAVIGEAKARKLKVALSKHRDHLNALRANSPNRSQVADLLGNARRRFQEGRYDDAVARLYRAIEAFAQLVLKEKYHIPSTKNLPLDRIPDPLKKLWAARAVDGSLTLGLQDSYLLLAELGDDSGRRFKELNLADREKSPLVARNQSILAHGFDPISKNICDQLWQAVMELTQISESEIPTFPSLDT